MSLSPAIPSAPLVSNILFIAHGANRRYGIALEFLDLDGNSLASGLTDPDALEALGRQAMAVAQAARACDPAVVPIRQRPRANAPLMGTAATALRVSRFEPEGPSLDAEANPRALMAVAIAALALSIALVAWAIWA